MAADFIWDATQAKVENGVLKLVLPKAPEHGPTVTDIPIE